MSYEQFIENMAAIIKGRMEISLDLSIHSTVKNNGYQRKGITFSEEGINISPTIYLEEYYEKFMRGSSVKELAEQVLEMYRKIRIRHSWNEVSVQDYQNIKDKIIYKLVNQERNGELLDQVPHVRYLDLAILYFVLVDMDKSGGQMATMLIRNEHLTWWNVTSEEIRRRADMNTEKILPYEFSAMCMMIEEMLGNQEMEEEEWKKFREQENMYILTNHIRSCGASAILYPGRLQAIGDYFKENYFIFYQEDVKKDSIAGEQSSSKR